MAGPRGAIRAIGGRMSEDAPLATRMVFHVDMDSFYASIESRDHPKYRDKPLVIGADPKEGMGRGVVSTCSYEARKFGIHSAMPISKAYKLCPHAIFVRPNHRYYVQVSRQIMEIIRGIATSFEKVSIDEAYFEVGHADFDRAEEIARSVKDAVKEAHQLTCSVGVGPTKSVAKIASDFNKPDGITIVRPEKLKEFFDPMPVSKIPGIGKKSVVTYHEFGIETIGVLARYDRKILEERLGQHGLYAQDIARGLDPREVRPRSGSKSISRERTFHKDSDAEEELEKVLEGICRKVHQDLLEEPYWFRTVTLKLRDSGFNTFTRAMSLNRPSRNVDDIIDLAFDLFHKHWHNEKIRLMGVKLSGLYEPDKTQTILDKWCE